ncbi:hypothetical protein BGX27_005511 [Mortierella sp. AM989]|nr:hypothetical protein BGX27_005511 [Mortierella sp. AM989]
MVATYSLLLLTILAGSSQQNGLRALVQAYQNSEHYYLPANIYDNLPSGIQTPVAAPTIPTPSPTMLTTATTLDGMSTAPGPNSPLSVEITTPLLNTIHIPGSELVMTWTNIDVSYPENWAPPQSILDMITKDPNFSNSPLLTKEDMTNLAKIKLTDLRRAQLLSILKDSSFRLHSLRLVSWPLQSSVAGNEGEGSSMVPLPASVQQQQTSYYISPDILSDPGFTLQNISQVTGAGGQLTWMIPEDWKYEGEFEIRIPSLSGSGSSTDRDNAVNVGSAQGEVKSPSFWILRDAATRTSSPQYNLPSMDQQQRAISSGWRGMDIQRQKDLGVFLGVAAMMLAFVLIGLGAMVGVYRRKWAAQSASSASSIATETNSLSYSSSTSSSARSTEPSVPGLHQEHSVDPLKIAHGDEDAHSPTDLNLSESTLGGIEVEKVSEKAMAGKDCQEQYSPVGNPFVDLPLYVANESSSTLAAGSSSNQDLCEKSHDSKE